MRALAHVDFAICASFDELGRPTAPAQRPTDRFITVGYNLSSDGLPGVSCINDMLQIAAATATAQAAEPALRDNRPARMLFAIVDR